MQCFVCGKEMRVVRVEPHVVEMRGFELRTFQCVGCGDVEKRPVFDGAQSSHARREALPQVIAPLAQVESEDVAPQHVASQGIAPQGIAPQGIAQNIAPPPAAAPVVSSRVRSIIGGLVRLRSTHP